MIEDPIVTEVRKVRDRHAAKFNYDLDAIYRDLKEKEHASGRQYVRFQPRLFQIQDAAVTGDRVGCTAQVSQSDRE